MNVLGRQIAHCGAEIYRGAFPTRSLKCVDRGEICCGCASLIRHLDQSRILKVLNCNPGANRINCSIRIEHRAFLSGIIDRLLEASCALSCRSLGLLLLICGASR